MSERDDRTDNEFAADSARLREQYRQLPEETPSELTDKRILAEAHRAVRTRHPAAWLGVVALAASIGFAVILMPNLLLEEPARVADTTVTLSEAPAPAAAKAERKETARQSAAREQRARSSQEAEAMLAAPALEELEEDRQQAIAQALADSAPDLAALRAELSGAPETEWRATLVALRDGSRRELAEQLMPEYRRKFDIDEATTLDMLVAEATP